MASRLYSSSIHILLSVLLVVSLAQGARAEGTENSRAIRADSKNKAIIVFVHGWTGKAVQTWTNERTGAYWPELLRTDPAFADANIYVLEYPAATPDGGLTINEISELLYGRLFADKVLSHERVIFLAHSLGGLTVRQMLLNHKDLADKVSLLFFFGTPTEGSDLATIGKYLSYDPIVPAVEPIKGSADSYLKNLMISWGAAKFPFQTMCAYEKKVTVKGPFSAIVVSQTSATALCNGSVGINEAHENLVKPADTRADSYIQFKNVAERLIADKSNVETVDLSRTVDASNIKCNPKDGKIDEVNIDDDLHFVHAPPETYLARAEAMPGESVRIFDRLNDTEPPAETNKSGSVTYYKVGVSVKDDLAKVRYAWKNAHSDDDIEVWARPSALLRNFDVTLKPPAGAHIRPRSILPKNLNCQWGDANQHVSCTKILNRDEPVVITWDWDVWKRCPATKKK
ncbi:triacylglycerol lipase [Bradyrhizobium sp. Ec3.3]|uniref:esterase/lipase family protein n=1 Tax=Bradyrhizobium sp. Ec3.3 TaxID=189753 RepID=UPI0003F845A8|nr:hypothetical protein [Bradyrhizobium sp. Ec3.3]